ncbi:MAG: XRE family transcriptional regulator, partial [Desulfobacterales bacterium]|nr:XRE family transcriptional regulator [Desulfobacterales bacterium]
ELSTDAQRRVDDRTAELVGQELAIRDLRKAMAKTQVQIARTLDVGQVAVSRIEKRGDLMISTLRSYLRAMGADLELRAVFKDRPAVKLVGFSELCGPPKRSAAKAQSSAAPTTSKRQSTRQLRRVTTEA